jgi:hypothetical protein
MSHLRGLGYTVDELLVAGLARQSARGRIHAHFRSRIMFPVKDREGLILGFAGLGTHLGPSGPLGGSSPDTGLYRRSEAVFGLDRAAKEISAAKTALVRPDCIEVLRAHQDGRANAVTVHTEEITREQMLELADGVRGGLDALELDLPSGMLVEPRVAPAAPKVVPARAGAAEEAAGPRPTNFNLKRLAIITATALLAVNAWSGVPLLAVWIGSQVQGHRLLSMRGVVSVLVALAILEFAIGFALTWLSAKYDQLTGRPRTAGQTSPWHRAKRGDRVQDVRSRYGVSAPEKVVAGCVVVGVFAFEVWFFFLAGSSIG